MHHLTFRLRANRLCIDSTGTLKIAKSTGARGGNVRNLKKGSSLNGYLQHALGSMCLASTSQCTVPDSPCGISLWLSTKPHVDSTGTPFKPKVQASMVEMCEIGKMAQCEKLEKRLNSGWVPPAYPWV
ncbi:uncharacterized protein LOC143034430 [Oratosquilla oratoria]|uniref:uncharacterized protein LOC143034430 n=1 Tax=Oratosquilla oratoria TaxID=337810 RepID=UPI003F774766